MRHTNCCNLDAMKPNHELFEFEEAVRREVKVKVRHAILVLFSLLSWSSVAVEVDDISAYYSPIQDSTAYLNSHVNHVIKEAVERTSSCDPVALEREVLKALTPKGLVNRTFFGGIERFAMESTEVDKFITTIEDSIYRGTPFERGLLVIAGNTFKIGSVFPSIKMQGVVFGTDKLSHFFENGHDLFEKHLKGTELGSVPEQNLNLVLDASIEVEEGHLGWSTTGIKSYGDIHAHIQGAFFWQEFLSADSGWWSCEHDRIVIQRRFDFADYVHDGWSEAINCNEYVEGDDASSILDLFKGPPPPYQATVTANAIALENKSNRPHQCPIDGDGCVRAANALRQALPAVLRRDEVMMSIISPACRSYISGSTE